MHYEELIKVLQKKYKVVPVTTNCSPKIMDIKLLSGEVCNLNKNTLYLGSITNLNTKINEPIMLLSNDDICTLPQSSNYSIIDNNDLIDLFHYIKDLLFEDLKAEALLFELSQLALNGSSIINIINNAASLLGNALILVDSNMKVLVHSTVYEIVDPLWAENIDRGYYSHKFIQKLRSNKQMTEWTKNDDETQFIKLSGDNEQKLVARITYQGHLVGAIIMIEHHTQVNHTHIKQLPIIGKILFDVFSYNVSEGSNKSFYSSILYSLLDDTGTLDTFELVNMTKDNFPRKMYVVVTRFINPTENRYLKRSISTELERIFTNGYSVQYKSYISILVPSISNDQKEKLENLSKSENINVGISWTFTNIFEFKRYFNQAVASIKQAQCFGVVNKVLSYTDFYFYDLLHNYTGKISLTHYCNPALKILYDYDKANKTDLYNTLRIYLECNKNLRATAKTLFIHRNSLTYRINRIIDITKLDFNDANVIYSLIDSFRIDYFLSLLSSDKD